MQDPEEFRNYEALGIFENKPYMHTIRLLTSVNFGHQIGKTLLRLQDTTLKSLKHIFINGRKIEKQPVLDIEHGYCHFGKIKI